MNTNILKRCLAELQSATPRLEYIEGMLETLIEMTEKELPNNIGVLRAASHPPLEETLNDEASILDAKAKAALQTVKSMSEASSHE